ncbi:hypothetical protein ACOMHN_019660 [Nucella lapillus]
MLPLQVAVNLLKKWSPFRDNHMETPTRCSRRCGHISFTNGENLYVWGGHSVNGRFISQPKPDEVWVFHNEFESWSLKICTGNIPLCTSGACSALLYPYLYVICGHCQDVGHSSRLRRLNLTTFMWETVDVESEALISPRDKAVSWAYQDKRLWTWREALISPRDKAVSWAYQDNPRDKAVSWAYQDKLYCFGGYGPDPEFSGLFHRGQGDFTYGEGYNNIIGWNNQLLTFDPSKNEWSLVKSLRPHTVPSPRAAHAAVLMGDKVYLFGGRHMLHRLNDLHCLDLKTMTWGGRMEVMGPVPEGRSWHTLSRLSDDRLFLCGGFSQHERVFDDAWIYTLSEQRWTQVVHHNLLFRGWHTAVVTSSSDVLVFGGFTDNILGEHFGEKDITETVVRFSFEPQSLKQLSLRRVYSQCSLKDWDQLPKQLQEWLYAKRRLQPPWLALPLADHCILAPIVVNGLREWTDSQGG